MKLDLSKEWCMRMAEAEGDVDVTVGRHPTQDELDVLQLFQTKYVLKNLNVERPDCGYDILADACDRVAMKLIGARQ